MENGTLPICGDFLKRFDICNIRDPDELIYGTHLDSDSTGLKCWAYRPATEGWQTHPRGQVLSSFANRKVGALALTYVAGRYGTSISILEHGLPYYCVTTVTSGRSEYQAACRNETHTASERIGLIFPGTAGTQFRTTDNNDRLNIWFSAASLEQRLAALLDAPVHDVISFIPTIDWGSAAGQCVSHLIRLLCEELATPPPGRGNDLVNRSFEDLFIYTVLRRSQHNYSDRLAQPTPAPSPRAVHRAEAFMREHADKPVAVHEIANAAGCSVRALQLGFRRFRETTPRAAMRRIRLQAVQRAVTRGEVEGSVGELAWRYGFTHPGRFARLYETTFGVSLAKVLQTTRPNSPANAIIRESRDVETAHPR